MVFLIIKEILVVIIIRKVIKRLVKKKVFRFKIFVLVKGGFIVVIDGSGVDEVKVEEGLKDENVIGAKDVDL